MEIHDFVPLVSGFIAGFFLGLAYFRLMHYSIEAYTQSGIAAGITIGVIARIVVAALAFWLLAQWSSLALLSGLFGFIIARYRVLKSEGFDHA